jgi:cytochrome c oxidase assembly protein subunit 11
MTHQPHQRLTRAIIALIMSMVLLSFAAVPIYNLFCKLTGFGGTTQRAYGYSRKIGHKTITVHFDSNVAPNLEWKFIPKHNKVDVMPGENVLIFYYSKNLSDKDIVGTALYNVTPQKAGKYFNKIHCFCFEEQMLRANAEANMPVTFYIDPAIETDPDTKDVDEITLSYSFFKVR